MLGALLPEIVVTPPGPASRGMAERLARVESRNVTFSDADWPVFWTEAVGANVRDADGNVYVDLTGAFGVGLLGHGDPGVRSAVARQLDRLVHGMGDIHPPVVKLELLERLAALAPWEDARAVLATSGSEAVEAALKTAQLASGRAGILAFEGAYHGLTLGSLAVTRRDHFRAPFRERLYGGVAFAPFPAGSAPAEDVALALEEVDRLLTGGAPNGDEIGTLVVEPVQARAGCRIPAEGFLEAVSGAARRRGVIVVADEIFTGLGRCGAPLASSLVGLAPDIVCVGKVLGGGLPLSACLASGRIMDAWPPSDGEAIHTSTFLGHPLACAAGITVLDRLSETDVPGRAAKLGADLAERLRGRLRSVPTVVEVRGMGLLIGVELEAGSGAGAAPGARVAEACLRRGVLVLPAGPYGRVVELAPPLCLTNEQMEHAVGVLGDTIEEGK